MPVSVVGYGDDLLIANYSQIYRYDRSAGRLLKMEPILEDSQHGTNFNIENREPGSREVLRCANGPGWDHLNMPYAVQVHNRKLLIMSTYQSRLIEIDPLKFQVTNNLAFGRRRWNDSLQGAIKKSAILLNENGHRENYINRIKPGIKLGGMEYLLAYRQLYPVSLGSAPIVVPGEGLLNPTGDFSFLQAKTVNDSVILWSSSDAPVESSMLSEISYMPGPSAKPQVKLRLIRGRSDRNSFLLMGRLPT